MWTSALCLALASTALAARQPYDVHKIIDAFRQPYDDLTILCAHRGLRWNATADNSRQGYFRASQAGIECIETDIRITSDGHLVMIHDTGLGRETDIGEFTGREAYNPYTGKGYNPAVANTSYRDVISHLHLRDEGGRVQEELAPTLIEIVQEIYNAGTNVVLQLDFKDPAAVEPTYWALKTLTNAAGVPANEWCIYKMQARWHPTPADFEAEAWVQDAFANNIQLAYIPVYNHDDAQKWDVLSGLHAYQETNYTISAEINMYSSDGNLQPLLSHIVAANTSGASFNTTGIFYAPGDVIEPIFDTRFSWYNTSNYTDANAAQGVYGFQDDKPPALIDSSESVRNFSVDGHDHRSDFAWILDSGFHWVITDTADVWDYRLKAEGRRNMQHLVRDGAAFVDENLDRGYYRRHARAFGN